MNKRAELEISLNKRTIERTASIVIITLLAIMYFTKGGGGESELTGNITKLQTQITSQNALITELKANLSQKETAPTPPKKVEPVIKEPAAPAEKKLSGKIKYDWTVTGKVVLATDYNKDQIDELTITLKKLESQYANATSGSSSKNTLRDKKNAVEDDIAALSNADAKYLLEEVTVSVDNGLTEDIVLDYELCWETIECLRVKAKGTFSAPQGEVTVEPLALDIPTLITIKKSQTLQLRLLDDKKEVFAEEKVINGVQ